MGGRINTVVGSLTPMTTILDTAPVACNEAVNVGVEALIDSSEVEQMDCEVTTGDGTK